MSTKGTEQVGVSRRSFVKTAAVAAGATALTYSAQPVLRTLAADYQSGQVADEGEKVFSSYCRPNCNGGCAINVHVRDGNIVKTSQASLPEARYDRICARGLSHPQRVYSQRRIKYPMKRAGERGANQWERISWDQATTEIADRLRAVQTEYSPSAVGWFNGSGNASGVLHGSFPGTAPLLIAAIGATSITMSVDAGHVPGYSRVYGPPTQFLGDNNEWSDLANARSVFAWALNEHVSQPHVWHFVADAMDNGAKLTVIDPNLTSMASKAHRHVRVRPGTDTPLMMSMMQFIIDEKIYDKEFLLAHSCAPFLVREDTGMYLRMSDLGVAPAQSAPDATGKITTTDPNVVWDPATGKPVMVDAVSAPALEGTFAVNGIKVTTAFDKLKAGVAAFTPEEAAKLTDVDPAVVRDMAREFATVKPAAQLMGMGSQAYDNAPAMGHAMATLNTLTGNVGKSGTSLGWNWQIFLGVNWGALAPTYAVTAPVTMSCLWLSQLQRDGELTMGGTTFVPLKALVVTGGNPMSWWPDLNYLREQFIPALDLIVVSDQEMTDTASIADYILPASSWFEYEDIGTGGTHPFVGIGEKAIDPLFESMPPADMYRLLAQKLGVGNEFSGTNDQMLKNNFETPYGASLGLTVDAVREKKAIRFMPKGYISHEDLKFGTPSGKLEFYSEDPAGATADRKAAERLPSWTPPTEAWPDNPLFAKYPLIYMSERPRFRAHTSFFAVPWLRELDPEPIIKMSTKDAADRGIENGDYVEIFNDRGHAVAKAVVSAGIKPGLISYPKGWQYDQFKAGSFSELNTKAYNEAVTNISFFDNLADVRKWNGQV